MLFSTPIFLFTFLPVALLLYHGVDRLFRNRDLSNFVLFLLSAFFYYWGSGNYIFYFFASILFNYYLGDYLYYGPETFPRKLAFTLGVTANLAMLGYFKYWNFFYEQIRALDLLLGGSGLSAPAAMFLPIGISFYTFMAISYLFETFSRKEKASTIVDFAMYLTLFPHLVAGPIVRFSEIAGEVRERRTDLERVHYGIWRFCAGLGKKVILANSLGAVADKVFALPAEELSSALAWMGTFCYTFQIYFDFSGYSDMAIGLAHFFGFRFPENFNAPYRAHSITEFWRRWHMTLSFWFRDFVYIPLGGNRLGPVRTYFNLFIVFFLCGLWHGTSWHFVIWGCYHGLLLTIERLLKTNWNIELKGTFAVALTFMLTMVGWVLFRATSLTHAGDVFSAMLGMSSVSTVQYYTLEYYLPKSSQLWLLVAVLLTFIPIEKIRVDLSSWQFTLARSVTAFACMFYAIVLLSKMSFTPFVYFQF